jgi:recombination protein RecT
MSNITPRGASTPPSKPAATLESWLESDGFRAMVAKALPRHLTPDRFLRVALTATMRVPKLAQCTQESVTQCLLQCSQFGLEPDGRRAHLIPFDDKRNNRTICTLILDYKGLVELAMRSGLVSHLHADVVREGDVFSYSLGEIKEHVPWFLRRDRDKPEQAGQDIAVYAFARMRDGASAVAVMSIDEVYAIRDGSQGYKAWRAGYVKSSTWDPDNWVAEQEMKKKTALRRLTKMLPLSPEFRDAVEADDASEETVAIDATSVTVAKPVFRTPPAIAENTATPVPTFAQDDGDLAPAQPKAKPAPAPAVEAAPAEPTEPPQQRLASLVTGAGVTWDQFAPFLEHHKYATGDGTGFDGLPTAIASRLLRSPEKLVEAVRTFLQPA